MGLLSTIGSALFGGGGDGGAPIASGAPVVYTSGGIQLGAKNVGSGSSSGSAFAGEVPAAAVPAVAAPVSAQPWNSPWVPAAVVAVVLLLVFALSGRRR